MEIALLANRKGRRKTEGEYNTARKVRADSRGRWFEDRVRPRAFCATSGVNPLLLTSQRFQAELPCVVACEPVGEGQTRASLKYENESQL